VNVAQQAERQRLLSEALQALDAASRSVIVLRDLLGYSYEELAQVLRCRVGTVKSRLSRARLRLRDTLEGRWS
jgi:RNA polymerase sigma-70 factor (ECF subfamily)